MSALGEMNSTLLRLKITPGVTKVHIYKVLEKEKVRKWNDFIVNTWCISTVNPKQTNILCSFDINNQLEFKGYVWPIGLLTEQ